MKVVKVLPGLTMALAMVSAVVFAANPATQANVDETYKKVLMPGTTVVTGYPDKNEFYVVSEKEMPVLLAELSQRRDFDELKLLAAEHDKVHQTIRLNQEIVLALNSQVKRLQSENPQPVKAISAVSTDKQLEFKFHPDSNVPMTPARKKSDDENFAVKVASQFKQSLIHLANLDKPVSKPFKPVSSKIKKAVKVKKVKKIEPVKSRHAASDFKPAAHHRVKHVKKVTQTKKHKPAIKFKVIEYSDIVAKKKQPKAHPFAAKQSRDQTAARSVKPSHNQSVRKRHAIARKKAAHHPHQKPVRFVVKELKLDNNNHLVLVDSAAHRRSHVAR